MKGDVTALSDGKGGVFYGTEHYVKGVGRCYALSDDPPKQKGPRTHPFPKSKRELRRKK